MGYSKVIPPIDTQIINVHAIAVCVLFNLENAVYNYRARYFLKVFQYFINIIKLWPEGQITDNNSKILKALLIYKTIMI